MKIELDNRSSDRVNTTKRTDLKPKSFRMTLTDQERLDAFKEILIDRTGKQKISDTIAVRVLIALSKHASESSINKACGDVL